MRAVLGTPRFWSTCGCFYLDFYYYAYGESLHRFEIWLEGSSTPLLSVQPVSEPTWKHMRRTYWSKEPTELLIVAYSGDSSFGDIAIDDLNIEACDMCPTAQETTTTTTTSTSTTTTTTTTPPPPPTTTTSTSTTTTSTSTSTSTSTTTTTTTSPTTTTTPPFDFDNADGQDDCDFDSDMCGFIQPNTVGVLKWRHVGSNSERVPSADTIGTGMYAYVNTDNQATTDYAQLMTGSAVYNPNSCHSVRFRHSISSGTLGTLRVWLMSLEGAPIKSLWSSSVVTNGWAPEVNIAFRYDDRFRLMFEAKRTTATGGSKFALDDVVVPVTDCTSSPLYPPSETSTATENVDGTETNITGTAGVIESPNYPQFYPNSFSHKWTIRVPSPSTIKLTILTLDTESGNDNLVAVDEATQAVLFNVSGNDAMSLISYASEGNQVSLTFTTDAITRLSGWQVSWSRVDVTTIPPTTTPSPKGYMQCQFDSATDCMTNIDIMNNTEFQWGWEWMNGMSPNYPTSGPNADADGSLTSGYLFLDSSPTTNAGTLGAFQVGPIFHNSGLHRLGFFYHANGDNLGSLSVSIIPVVDRRKRQTDEVVETEIYLWSSLNVPQDSWREVSETFRQDGEFYIQISAKRKKNSDGQYGGGDLAIDDFMIVEGTQQPADVGPDLDNGGLTSQTGTSGVILSPFYPYSYDLNNRGVDFTHTWDITVDPGYAIEVYFVALETEDCCDKVTITDPETGTDLVVASGNLPSPPSYKSSGNRLIVKFAADEKLSLTGFEIRWYLTEPAIVNTVPVPITVGTTSELPTAGATGASKTESVTSNWEWIVVIVLFCVAVVIIIIMIIYIRKRNAEKNKVGSSQEKLNNGAPQLVGGESNDNYGPQVVYGHYYDRPTANPYYDTGSMGGQTATTALNDSGRYGMIQYEHPNLVTSKPKLGDDGQIVKKKKKKAKKLDPLRGSSQKSKPQTGMFSVPDGQGNAAAEEYLCCQHRDNPPHYDV